MTLVNVRGESTQSARHTEAVAELLAGHPRRALSKLRTTAEQSNDPAVWSDLSAAFHETALHDDAPELLADALAASDRALSQQHQFPEALFNRALVLERLGLRDDAREGWERYLASDSTSDWATEARTHLDALAPEEAFLDRLDREYDHMKDDPAVATLVVRSDPFGARGTGVKEVLGRWGKAALRHDDREAERQLSVARQLGAAVTLAEGDRMLEGAVAVIDSADGATRLLLASAHSDFRDGSAALDENRPGDAEPLLRGAAAAFEKAQSPMVLLARLLAANALFEQGRHDDTEHEIRRLAAMDSTDFPAFRALLLRVLGTCRTSLGDWGGAIPLLEQSTSLSDRLGEIGNASAVRRILAFIYDRIGDPATAWKYRLAALRGLGGRSNVDLEKGVASVADAAILRHEWRTALSFLSLEIRIAHRLHDDLQLAATPLVRAAVRDRLNDEEGALADIGDARQAMARTKDPAYRAFLHVAELRASAMLSGTPPAGADALLSEAIEYQSTQSDPLKLPGLFLQRARARRKTGNVSGAMADVQRGIAELEQHRRSLPPGEARWGAFHPAEELFDEGIDLAMSIDDPEAAFRFAERARARALLDAYGRSPILDYRRMPARTVVVEYASLPSRLVIFTADASGVRAATVECSRERLAAEVDALGEALRQARSIVPNSEASAVYQHLIKPVAPQLLGAATVVFVPDGATSTVAFSALPDARGQFLIQLHAIVVAPSAAAFVANAERRGDVVAPRSALVISASEPGAEAGALSFVDSEARRVVRAYRKATRLADDAAELDELMKRAPEVDVIHFAGHAIGDDRGIDPASIVLRQNGHERRVGVTEIARLHLRPTSVVVLAGCSTARGERRAAEGVISVAHGFLSAGAPSVIATLWPIDDEAASIFFPRVHERLAEGLSAAEALRQAQLESIRRGDVPASLWAAVQNIGS
ncbi:MAG TPA: CHAT domain-containing protein [Thermoanaerobaculia bacterium]|nr:CHAT domain-containing protein [Thermoanaerobaculia bacterium]